MNHDLICKGLEKRLNKLGCYTWLNEEYRVNGQCGECDVFGINLTDRVAYIGEVKETDGPKHRLKAKSQLDKDVNYYTKLFKGFDNLAIHTFYAYSAHTRRGYYAKRLKIII